MWHLKRNYNQEKVLFNKLKEEIKFLENELKNISLLIEGVTDQLPSLIKTQKSLSNYSLKYLNDNQGLIPSTGNEGVSTDRQTNQTDKEVDKEFFHFKSLKRQIPLLSTGNEGVSTDRQTNQQTDNQQISSLIKTINPPINSLDKASEIIISLDMLKRDLKTSISKLTDQEFLVFSTIYQLEQDNSFNGFIDYPLLSDKLKLTESSIRDYILRIIKKGIPLNKKKVNNKKIVLSIPTSFKQIATLSSILTFRTQKH